MNGAEHRLAHLTRTEVAARAPSALAVLPLGATEQHGPHLITGTDHLLVEHIAHQAAAAAADSADVIVAPTVPYGFSAYHQPFGATVTIGMRTLMAFLEDACTSLLASGFRRVLVLNGHGGNDELIRAVARQVGADTGALIAAGSYWVIAWDRLLAAGVQEHGRLPGHAGAFETSLVAALIPDLAERPRPNRPARSAPRARYQADVHVEDPRFWSDIDGYSDNPAAASEQIGRLAAREIIAAVADAFRELASRELRASPSAAGQGVTRPAGPS